MGGQEIPEHHEREIMSEDTKGEKEIQAILFKALEDPKVTSEQFKEKIMQADLLRKFLH